MNNFTKKLRFLFLFFVLFAALNGYSQTLDPVQLQATLEQKGIPKAKFEERMNARGVNINNAASQNPAEVQRIALEVIDELEKEQKANTPPNPAPNPPTPDPKPADPSPQAPAAAPTGADAMKSNEPPSDIFAMDVLRSNNVGVFLAGGNGAPSDAYVLGPGDRVTVNIWGAASFTGNYVIDNDGYIRPERVPPIFLKGMSLGKARGMIRSRFAQFYPFISDNFEVIVSGDRKVTVNLSGEIKRFGSYTLAASHTAINAIIAAGGPTDIGSLRTIRLIRSGEKPRIIDMYEFMNNPSVAKDYFLQDNDFIHIPTVNRVVSIKGAVRRPMKYELIDGEQMFKLLDFAGGLVSNAFTRQVSIRRFVNNEEQVITIDLADLFSKKQDYALLNGDEINIATVTASAENFVTVLGEVLQEGPIALTSGMKIADVFGNGLLKPSARIDVVFVERTNLDQTIVVLPINLDNAMKNKNSLDNISLQKKDKILIYAQSRYSDRSDIKIAGAVRNEGQYAFDAGRKLRFSDLVLQAGGLKNEADSFAYIIRQNPANREEFTYIRINSTNAIRSTNAPDNLVLMPFDSVYITSNTELNDKFRIEVLGEVRKEGVMPFAKQMLLRDALYFAGGLKLSASLARIEVFRVMIQGDNPVKTIVATLSVDENYNPIGAAADFVLQPFDIIVVRTKPEFKLQRMVMVSGEVRYPGMYALLSDNEPISSVVDRAGGLTAEAYIEGGTLRRTVDTVGFVVIDFKKAVINKDKQQDISLKVGDIVFIPKRNELVSIAGWHRGAELYQDKLLGQNKTITVPFAGSHRAMFYIRKFALGASDSADLNLVTVEHPNGRLEKTKNFGLFKIYPKVTKGSTINIAKVKPEPVDPLKATTPKEDIDWGNVLSNAIQQSLSVLSLILLIQRLN